MINEPIAISARDFQQAWLSVTRLLIQHSWEIRNLMVQITNPDAIDDEFQREVENFACRQGLLSPKQVAYTIFPHRLYKGVGDATRLFQYYNKSNGYFDRIHRKKHSWGTYFRRMSYYKKDGIAINQLDNIIQAVRTRINKNQSAFTIIIQNPGGETLRPLGGPCLNYIAVQIQPSSPRAILGLLAVYRNHDFLERAYGNYWGLCNLLLFLSGEVDLEAGPLTCVSSHAYVAVNKRGLKSFVENL